MGVRRRRTTALLGAPAMIAAVALAGCSSDSSDTTALSEAAPAVGEAAADQQAPEQGAEPGAAAARGGVTEAKAPNLSVDQRSIIYTGSITVRVENVNLAAARATAIAAGAGGFVGGDKRSTGGGAAEASLELRVPAAKFSAVVDQLAGLGVEEQRGVGTEDVTEQTLDLDARIATQQARVASGRRLLSRATSLDDLVMLEGEVAKREADLASLTAKKRRLADLTALSTITAVLLDPQAAAQTRDDEPTGFLGGLRNGWTALVASLAVLLTVLGALLPWLIALGLPAWAALWLVRRYRRRTGSTAATSDPVLRPALATAATGPGSAPPTAPPAPSGSPTSSGSRPTAGGPPSIPDPPRT